MRFCKSEALSAKVTGRSGTRVFEFFRVINVQAIRSPPPLDESSVHGRLKYCIDSNNNNNNNNKRVSSIPLSLVPHSIYGEFCKQ